MLNPGIDLASPLPSWKAGGAEDGGGREPCAERPPTL